MIFCRRRLVSVGVLGAVLALAACSFGGGGSPAPIAEASSGTTASGAAAVSSGEVPLATEGRPRTPLVPELTGTDHSGNTLAYAPVTLHREGDLVVLELGVRNITPVGKGEKDSNLAWFFMDGSAAFNGVSLVDTKNRKRHRVVSDSDDKCLCSSFIGGLSVPRGGHGSVTAYFAAPPADITSMEVVLAKKGTFSSVPVS